MLSHDQTIKTNSPWYEISEVELMWSLQYIDNFLFLAYFKTRNASVYKTQVIAFFSEGKRQNSTDQKPKCLRLDHQKDPSLLDGLDDAEKTNRNMQEFKWLWSNLLKNDVAIVCQSTDMLIAVVRNPDKYTGSLKIYTSRHFHLLWINSFIN